MIDVLPGILEQDFTVIQDKIAIVAPYVTWIHVDVADHTLVNNQTFLDFEQWKDLPMHLSFEAHLMVAHPEKYIRPLVNAGFKRLIAHIECEDPRRFLEQAQFEDVEVGLALDGPSPIEEIEPFLGEVDSALIMGIESGYSGQEFQLDTLEKLRAIHLAFPEVILEVDGGVNDKTAKAIKEAGATRLVSTSFLFKNPSALADSIAFLKE